MQIKLPTVNESLSSLKCVQIVGGSKSLFCGLWMIFCNLFIDQFVSVSVSDFLHKYSIVYWLKFLHACAQSFNGLFSRTARYADTRRTNHSLLQTDKHASTSSHKFFTGRMLVLPPSQWRQSTELFILVNKLHAQSLCTLQVLNFAHLVLQ